MPEALLAAGRGGSLSRSPRLRLPARQTAYNTLIWNFIAFGERHPDNPNTRTVYERAHKRLHGSYP